MHYEYFEQIRRKGSVGKKALKQIGSWSCRLRISDCHKGVELLGSKLLEKLLSTIHQWCLRYMLPERLKLPLLDAPYVEYSRPRDRLGRWSAGQKDVRSHVEQALWLMQCTKFREPVRLSAPVKSCSRKRGGHHVVGM